MLRNVDRFCSPDGTRIAFIARDTGEAWLAVRQTPEESAALRERAQTWTKLRPHPNDHPPLTLVP